MDRKTCADCEFFVQHYRVDNGKPGWVLCGHCTAKRVKYVSPTAKSCLNFQEKSPIK